MRNVLDWSLVDGVVPAVLTGLGALAGGVLLARRSRAWWVQVLPAIGGGTAVLCLLMVWVVDVVWRPFPDSLPWRVVLWGGVAVFAMSLAVSSVRGLRWRRRVAVVLAAVLVPGTAAMKINAYYGQYPTLRAAFALPRADEVAFTSVQTYANSPYRPQRGKPLMEGWKPPITMPDKGVITQTAIPSPVSGFAARDAYIYLPPAYLTSSRPLLPVVVLLHGQPGAPVDWINGGRLGQMMDAFAAAHHGLAPIVVVPDATGGDLNNPLCLDSKLGNSESYLTKDVPNWISRNLQVDRDTHHWAVAGFSYGGTCSVQLALRRPDLFPSFVDISGQREPTLGTRKQTVTEAFGGNEDRFRQVNPLDELLTQRFPGTAGVLTAGSTDSEYLPQARDVYAACLRNGIDVTWHEVPGSHTWEAWAAGLQLSLGWMAARTGLVGS